MDGRLADKLPSVDVRPPVLATADAVTLRIGSATQQLPRAAIASAARMKDGRRDGAIKGAISGVITGALALRAYHRNPEWLFPNANRAGCFSYTSRRTSFRF